MSDKITKDTIFLTPEDHNLTIRSTDNDTYANIVTYQCSDNLNITTFLSSDY